MKRCVFIFLLIVFAACNDSSTNEYVAEDTVATHTPRDRDTFYTVEKNASIKSREEILKEESSKFQPDNRERVEMLAPFFTPHEVYIEILRRSGDLSKDTIPDPIAKNYSQKELSRILEKNTQLHSLSGRDIIALYKYVFGVIIGPDNRYSVVYDPLRPEVVLPLTSPEMEDAKCVMAIISRDSLQFDGKGKYVYLSKSSFGEKFGLCGEVFSTEPAFSSGTGFVVGEQTMITANHCIDSSNYHKFYFVFDFILDSNKNFHRIIDESKVYEAKSLKGHYDVIQKIDYSIVRLNKKVPQFRVRPLKRAGGTGNGREYHVIGTPGGLPLKVAGNAKVKRNNHSEYFTILSDTYVGNSGSPVFNSDTHEIEGILVGGGKDWGFKKIDGVPCAFSLICPSRCDHAPDGERVSRVSQFIQFLAN